jgi:hypothetical protein
MGTDDAVKCGSLDCVCARENLDIHKEEPILPEG